MHAHVRFCNCFELRADCETLRAGKSFATELARRGMNVVLLARSEDLLLQLKDELSECLWWGALGTYLALKPVVLMDTMRSLEVQD